jgi:hypothetical protein
MWGMRASRPCRLRIGCLGACGVFFKEGFLLSLVILCAPFNRLDSTSPHPSLLRTQRHPPSTPALPSPTLPQPLLQMGALRLPRARRVHLLPRRHDDLRLPRLRRLVLREAQLYQHDPGRAGDYRCVVLRTRFCALRWVWFARLGLPSSLSLSLFRLSKFVPPF